MGTLPQRKAKESRSVRVREDVWLAVRRKGYEERISMLNVIDLILRFHLGLPEEEEKEEAA